MTGNKTKLRAIAMAALVLITAFASPIAGTAAADSHTDDKSVMSGVLPQGEAGPPFSDYASLKGFVKGITPDVANPFGEDTGADSADEYAKEFRTEFNQNSAKHVQNWTNSRFNASEDHNVVRLKFKDDDGNSAWVFIVTDVNGSDYENATAMTLNEFKETNRKVDLTYRLEPKAAKNAADELETFTEDYAKPNEDLDKEYVYERIGKYGTHVDGPYLPSTSLIILFGIPLSRRSRGGE